MAPSGARTEKGSSVGDGALAACTAEVRKMKTPSLSALNPEVPLKANTP